MLCSVFYIAVCKHSTQVFSKLNREYGNLRTIMAAMSNFRSSNSVSHSSSRNKYDIKKQNDIRNRIHISNLQLRIYMKLGNCSLNWQLTVYCNIYRIQFPSK